MRKGLVAVTMAMAVVLAGGILQQQAMISQAAPVTSVQQVGAVSTDDDTVMIPSNAIRLRIIANSDSPADQQLKRDIRDRVIDAVAAELRGLKSDEAAREQLKQALPKLNAIAEQVIAEQGYSYTAVTDYGKVPFPTKMYGDQVYPAGEYEALRIQIGEAQGQNWWCVLFPPLCFVDMANGDAVAHAEAKDMAEDQTSNPVTVVEVQDATGGGEQEVEVRFALWDTVCNFFSSIFA